MKTFGTVCTILLYTTIVSYILYGLLGFMIEFIKNVTSKKVKLIEEFSKGKRAVISFILCIILASLYGLIC